MDPPPVQTLIAALESLYALGALNDEGLLTKLGRKMAEFPLEPQLSKMLLTSVDLGCSDEIITIVAMLTVQNVFYRPKDKQTLADKMRSKFYQPEGDHLTLLTVYEVWKANKSSDFWCHEACARRPQTAAHHHGALQTAHPQLQRRLLQDQESHLCWLLRTRCSQRSQRRIPSQPQSNCLHPALVCLPFMNQTGHLQPQVRTADELFEPFDRAPRGPNRGEELRTLRV
jgi:HrpA-like RNA helicase